VDPNITNTAGDTPLIKSLWRADNLDVVRALLAAGADVNQPDGYRRTPLTKAAWWGRTEVIRLLLQEGGAGLCADPGGRTALTEAAIKGRADAVRNLNTNKMGYLM
jgi:ankyrin repeat protein